MRKMGARGKEEGKEGRKGEKRKEVKGKDKEKSEIVM